MEPQGRGRRATDTGASEQPERRTTGDQRRYNRRSPVSDVPPPYYETFERIASALERIEAHLTRAWPPPDAPERPVRGVVPPARNSEQQP